MTLLEGKSAAWHANRRTGIGGSDARIIMDGSDEERVKLWEEKTGRREPEDLSDVLPVQMGQWTERHNLAWFERHTGMQVSVDVREFRRPACEFARCEVDGMIGFNALIDAKHVSALMKNEQAVEKNYTQMQHNMVCAGVEIGYLSVFFGTFRWEHFKIEADEEYQLRLLSREYDFWQCVKLDTPPPPLAGALAPKPIIALTDMREVDMTGNNLWGDKAASWIELAPKAKKLEKVAKEIKEMVEDDVSKASGHGITVSRSKAGALTIRETKK